MAVEFDLTVRHPSDLDDALFLRELKDLICLRPVKEAQFDSTTSTCAFILQAEVYTHDHMAFSK